MSVLISCQRGRSRRDSYRSHDEPIHTLDYEVARLGSQNLTATRRP